MTKLIDDNLVACKSKVESAVCLLVPYGVESKMNGAGVCCRFHSLPYCLLLHSYRFCDYNNRFNLQYIKFIVS